MVMDGPSNPMADEQDSIYYPPMWDIRDDQGMAQNDGMIIKGWMAGRNDLIVIGDCGKDHQEFIMELIKRRYRVSDQVAGDRMRNACRIKEGYRQYMYNWK
jgi:hypothetical protein